MKKLLAAFWIVDEVDQQRVTDVRLPPLNESLISRILSPVLFIDWVRYAACSELFAQPEAVCFQNSFSSQADRKQMVVECGTLFRFLLFSAVNRVTECIWLMKVFINSQTGGDSESFRRSFEIFKTSERLHRSTRSQYSE